MLPGMKQSAKGLLLTEPVLNLPNIQEATDQVNIDLVVSGSCGCLRSITLKLLFTYHRKHDPLQLCHQV